MNNTHSMRPFRNPSYIDYLVGWRYLFNGNYRAYVHSRWSDQPWFITGSEIITGLGSIIFSSGIATALAFIIWDGWLR
ncbi:MAG: hypothetical protein KZQ82_11400 [Candidatus Thiodiazotropha sp. (ex Lucinoma annulata)]|nr:hypothetical protein [Candidatus Thiodiazotropha sp. (ex Lucinoma borealis)]MCU7841043.1 hypothetical protein [Candidatus Thiodiazotropha sp. (ex Troendleina suluensis)]MCU7884790.1 hypothetical protein [Candidatus Thiodiazotropha sp. (ex Lucinoma annulata)]MCU7947306.1 hypothetical protein [Candidatus Thiodiazotropha sp. (ex Cardiolucina cf. quadrata)]MCU7856010.1 hypothetical protein [Candidatus Thiodiazotropha sp. (ex Lucinoma borealis)]